MISRIRVQFIVALVIMVFAVGIWASGDTLRLQWLRFYSVAVVVVLIALAAWDNWLWRLPLLQRVANVSRDIRGTWKGNLDSFWKDETGSLPARKTAYLVVRQSAWRVSVVLFTEESRSASSLARVSSDGTTVSLDYMYLNRPDSRLEERSRIHHGSTSLDIIGLPATRLRGRYWTNRDSRGELDFTTRVPQVTEDYEEAARAFMPNK
jgi:hypothetical protein